jgi:hypothetical protein
VEGVDGSTRAVPKIMWSSAEGSWWQRKDINYSVRMKVSAGLYEAYSSDKKSDISIRHGGCDALAVQRFLFEVGPRFNLIEKLMQG